MGLHTWFHKDRKLYDEEVNLYRKIDLHESGEDFLDDLDLLIINNRIDEIFKTNGAKYHDCFRTSKRNDDGSYIDDVIYSKEECDKWLEENKDKIYYLDRINLDKFWDEFPDGVIDFG